MTRWLIILEWESYSSWDKGLHKETSILYKHKGRAEYEYREKLKHSLATSWRSQLTMTLVEIEFLDNLVIRSEVLQTNG
jgi:hypothetical protein